MVRLKNETQGSTPNAHAHEAPKALTPRSAHCSANGYELTLKRSGKTGGMAIVSLSFQRL
jgi:putative hemolysin